MIEIHRTGAPCWSHGFLSRVTIQRDTATSLGAEGRARQNTVVEPRLSACKYCQRHCGARCPHIHARVACIQAKDLTALGTTTLRPSCSGRADVPAMESRKSSVHSQFSRCALTIVSPSGLCSLLLQALVVYAASSSNPAIDQMRCLRTQVVLRVSRSCVRRELQQNHGRVGSQHFGPLGTHVSHAKAWLVLRA